MKKLIRFLSNFISVIAILCTVFAMSIFTITERIFDVFDRVYNMPSKTRDIVVIVVNILLMITVWNWFVIQVKQYKRVQKADEKELNEEMLHAVSWWVWSFNKTDKERREYINKYFPCNKDRIQAYIDAHPSYFGSNN